VGRFAKWIYLVEKTVLQFYLYIEGDGFMKYLIYAYIKKENNQVVYVGLTNNL